MSNDYRNTKYDPLLADLKSKKADVEKLVKEAHPRSKDMHKYISVNGSQFKKEFVKSYNGKCAYCGVSIDIIPMSLFQIDHFVYQESAEFSGSKAAAGSIDNLVLACGNCNHNKSDFLVPIKERENLHPDNEYILSTFVRDNNYYIKIAEKQISNEVVKKYYEKLKLDLEIHRLDYLLMSMIGLQMKLTDKHPAYLMLGQAIDLLKNKRNVMA